MKRLCALILIVLNLRAAGAEVFLDAPPRENWYQSPLMRLTAFSAGQSDCMLIECGGEAMMADGGTAVYGEELIHALHELGVEKFKYLFNTHYHEDHAGGLIVLMENGFEVGSYLHPYEPNAIYGNVNHRRAMQTVKKYGIAQRQITNGDTLLLGEAVITLIRHEEGKSANGRSTMAHVQFGSASLLLTADIIGDTQSWCLEHVDAEMLDADILKAPHHGVSAMVGDFLQAVSPEMLLVNNDSSRAKAGIAQAEAFGVPVLCTGDGRIVLETDGEDWFVYQQDGF